MNTVKVRNLELGAGIPAICIPNVGKTKDEIISLTKQYTGMHMDMMEWRVDWFEGVEDIETVKDVLAEVRAALGDTPLLFTFRTKNEGGVHEMSTEAYAQLNKDVAATGMADLIDVEIFTGDEIVTDMITAIHAANTKVVASNHDFDKTPAQSDIVYRLRKMQDTLLAATEEMATDYADRPIITMSMAGMGSISRLSCEAFGSCLTFGSGSMASAPGQIGVDSLYEVLQIVHKAL